ncbi:LytTR family DNA-binding domain-containing protein [Alteromonas halophila]|uniref:HTH LytTR-type domain-containing protein n=1 Tax=Alteromonas halophila TaxID=516698 RepID=A0A918JL02_9ALTE|nr:LytTR family DNA-binding domain-containing protein [Alteromonas halophila]GGW86661.1 hypothetical protein GCM10007391_20460 [Alteromonas halophila]
MNSWDEKMGRFLRRTEQYHLLMLIGAAFIYFMVNNTINAASSWTELSRDPANTSALWEPYVWEYTSALSTTLLLLPLIFIIRRMAHAEYGLKKLLLIHLCLGSLFSVCHVALMVGLRKAVYSITERSYDFGPIVGEFFYEYRKDLWGYATLLATYYLIHFVYQRLIGEAAPVATEPLTDTPATPGLPAHLLVKKLNREFLVRLNDVLWVEAAGNYVNLHTEDGVYPLRMTMKQFCTDARAHHIYRIHRSYATRAQAISTIEYDDTGDGTLTLTTGTALPVSRRYKDSLKAAFSPALT